MAFEVDEEKVDEIVRRAAGMALLYGVQKKIETEPSAPETVVPMPFTLFPCPFPGPVLQEALAIETHFQLLFHRVAHDHEFLQDCLKDVLDVDEFTRRFWQIYLAVREEGISQPISLGLFRNDYMMELSEDDKGTSKVNQDQAAPVGHTRALALKQVEFNTFASGAGGVISDLPIVHRYNLSLAGVKYREEQLPNNAPTKVMAQGLVKAWGVYAEPSAVILFVVGVPEPNTPDQRWLERRIFEQNHNIRVIYRRFDQLMNGCRLTDDRRLFMEGDEVAVVYYRYGYSPKHYPTQKEFDLRLLIERSRAIKSTPINLHLAGCKKVQQELARGGTLERFIKDSDVIRRLRATFAGLYNINEGPEGDKHIDMALKTPEKFVLKPQREGGGNNLFGEAIRTKLTEIRDTDERNAYILMDRLQAYVFQNRLIRTGLDHGVRDVNSELGIFGVYLGSATEEVMNLGAGYLLRTKPVEANEGGLFSGLSCLDSLFLT